MTLFTPADIAKTVRRSGSDTCPRCGCTVLPAIVLSEPAYGRFAAYNCPSCHAAWTMRLTLAGGLARDAESAS